MVPVLLVTGFLGSGKTTLLNRMLERRPSDQAGRWAIIVNELGDVGVDGDLLPGDMTRQVELPNGCICCVLNEDLDASILELLDGAPDLELLVIETTGVAEPLPIAWTLEGESLRDRVRLAAVVTTVDAQVDYADVLIVTKLDLAGATEPPPALVAGLRQLNPEAPVLTGTPDELADALWALVADPRPRAPVPRPDGERGRATDGALHNVQTISVPISETLDFEELADALEELPTRYLRIKGIARVVDRTTGSDEPHFVAFHRVGTRVSRERLQSPAEGRMVALGRDLDRSQLAACVESAVVPCDAGE